VRRRRISPRLLTVLIQCCIFSIIIRWTWAERRQHISTDG
jgi:hypothetical protein